MKKNISITVIALMGGILLSCGSSEKELITELPAIPVSVASAQAIQGTKTISASGRIEASNSANISTRMMGNVTNVLVQPGDKVVKGELLLTITSADLAAKRAQVESSIKQAQSGFENAEKDFERFKVLFEKGSASEKELENITTRYEMAKAGLEAASQMKKEVNAQFAYTNIRAPFTGIVANAFVKVGDMANPGMPLLSVEGTENYQATVLVPESNISEVKLGASATVTIKSSNESFTGEVTEVSPSAKNTGGQFIVKVDLKTEQKILPGRFVNAEISVQSKSSSSTLLVDQRALMRNGQLVGLYALGNNDSAILRWIRTGDIVGDKVQVLSGISEGEKYIVEADGKLFNGARVVVR